MTVIPKMELGSIGLTGGGDITKSATLGNGQLVGVTDIFFDGRDIATKQHDSRCMFDIENGIGTISVWHGWIANDSSFYYDALYLDNPTSPSNENIKVWNFEETIPNNIWAEFSTVYNDKIKYIVSINVYFDCIDGWYAALMPHLRVWIDNEKIYLKAKHAQGTGSTCSISGSVTYVV